MKLTPSERAILVDLLVHGDNTPSNLADNANMSRDHANDCLSELEDRRLVKNKGRGVYRLTLSGTAAARDLYDD